MVAASHWHAMATRLRAKGSIALTASGGPTETRALATTSPALCVGDAACPPNDRCRIPRLQGTGCDIGAYELTPHAP
jgi:hypothetical protein